MQRDITIIICCYNGEKRLSKVMDKVYAQRELEQHVYEIIVVDNHSVDATKDIIYQYIDLNLRVSIRYLYEEKPGLSNARKKGVDACTTKWIAFLDDDNLVEEDWIQQVAKYIQEKPNVGVFNGAVIPYTPFNMSVAEEQRLKASLKVLACTHFNLKELKKKPVTPFRNPVGAGMVILTAPLKELSERGWLNSAGRTKDKLTSGEDGEMAFFVKNTGYDFGFCSDAVLYHEMSRERLDDAYLNKMWYEIGRGVAVVANSQKIKKMKLFCYYLLLVVRLLIYFCENTYKGHYYIKYIDGFKTEMQKRK
jgi:glycosyltransferase involved in cell wall biosynthesis